MNIIILTTNSGHPQNINYHPFQIIQNSNLTQTWFYSVKSSLIDMIYDLKERSIFIVVDLNLSRHEFNLIKKNHFLVFFEPQPMIELAINSHPLKRLSIDYYKYLLKKTLFYKAFDLIRNLRTFGLKKGDFLLSLSNHKSFFFHKHVCIHTNKYNEWIEKNGVANVFFNKKPYAVFVDSYTTDHPDYLTFNMPGKPINNEKYFKLLNKYFDYFEDKYELEVIVSPHPFAKYKSNEFNGRKVSYAGTKELIRNAKLIMAQHSTSILTAVLDNKKILLLYYPELLRAKSKPWFQRTVYYSVALNTELINIETENYIEFDWNIDDIAYNNFKKKYIYCEKMGTFSSEEILNNVVADINAGYSDD